MNINEVLSSSQQVMALELAVRSLAGGDAALDVAVETVQAEALLDEFVSPQPEEPADE
jgi:hypothetical protein